MLLSITGRSSRNKRGMDTGDLEREREKTARLRAAEKRKMCPGKRQLILVT